MRRYLVHGLTVDDDGAAVGRLEGGNHPQQGGLAATRGTEQREEFAALHIQADVIHNLWAAETFAYRAKGKKAHAPTVVFWAPRLRTCSARITRATNAVRISAPSASTMGRRSGKRSWPRYRPGG